MLQIRLKLLVLVVWLASSASASVTGQVILTDTSKAAPFEGRYRLSATGGRLYIRSKTGPAIGLANLASPTFTGTVSGITGVMVGLGSVNNTSDANKPVSTAAQTALNLKANLSNPIFSSNVTVNGGLTVKQGIDIGTFAQRGIISFREGENINGIRAYSGLYFSDDEYSILADNINLRTYNAATGDIIFSPSNSAKGVWKKSGNLLIGSTVDDAVNKLQVTGDLSVIGTAKATKFNISALNTAPASATDTGALGEIRVTAGYIFICTATNIWKRTAIATW
jgi:hypothetical protein